MKHHIAECRPTHSSTRNIAVLTRNPSVRIIKSPLNLQMSEFFERYPSRRLRVPRQDLIMFRTLRLRPVCPHGHKDKEVLADRSTPLAPGRTRNIPLPLRQLYGAFCHRDA